MTFIQPKWLIFEPTQSETYVGWMWPAFEETNFKQSEHNTENLQIMNLFLPIVKDSRLFKKIKTKFAVYLYLFHLSVFPVYKTASYGEMF